MQNEQVRFLLDTCFTKAGEDDALYPVMVKMILTNSHIDYSKPSTEGNGIKVKKMEFQVPLISLIPINSLAVNNIDIDFNMEITSMIYNEGLSQDNNGKVTLKGKIAKSDRLKDSLSKKEQSSRNLNVKINASSLPLSKGIIELIDIYTKSIHPVQGSADKIGE